MKIKSILIFFLLIGFSGASQHLIEKEYLILTIETDTNKDNHPGQTYYGIAEFDSNKPDTELEFYSLIMELYYSSDQYDDCCEGAPFHPYVFTIESKFDFDENLEDKMIELREFIKNNRRKLQTVKMKWANKYSEKSTIYGTPIKTKICSCELISKHSLKTNNRIFFPKSAFELNNEYWKKDRTSIIYRDFSNLVFFNLQ